MPFTRKSKQKRLNSMFAARSAIDGSTRPVIEQLEARRLLSSVLNGSIVTVTGTGNSDAITVSASNGTLTVSVSGDQQQYTLANVTEVDVNALGGGDTITLGNGAPASRVDAGDGNDTILAGPTDDTLMGGNGNDTYTFRNFTNPTSGWGNDLIDESLNAGTDTFDFSAITDGLLAVMGAFSATDGHSSVLNGDHNIENIIGGPGDDRFIFPDGNTHGGNIDGGAGTNLLFYHGYSTPITVNLPNHTATAVTGTVTNIQNVVGGAANDTLIGDNNANVLNGDLGNDTLTGNGGNDTFQFNDTWGSDTVNESIGGGSDSIDFTGATVPVTFTIGTGAITDGANTITQPITAAENISAGPANDTFVFLAAAAISGTINGGGGTNTLNYSAYNTSVTANLLTGVATGTGSVQGISDIIGGSAGDNLTGNGNANVLTGNAGNDTLTGSSGDDTYIFGNAWGNDAITEIAGAGTDTLNFSAATTNLTVTVGSGAITDGTSHLTQASTSAENVTTGSGNDTFVFQNGATLGGIINSGTGTNTLDYSAYTTGVTVNLLTGTATGTASIQSISNVTGGSGDDALTGNDNDNVLAESLGIDTLTGNGGNDTYKLSFTTIGANSPLVTVHEATAGGTDTLDLSGTTVNLRFNIGSDPATGGTISTNLIDVGSQTLVTQPNTQVENLIGGSAPDSFDFQNAGSIAGTVNGGGGENKLNYSAYATSVSVNLLAGTATGTSGIQAIANVTGGLGDDSITGDNNNNILVGGISGATGTDGNDTLTGNGGNDFYNFLGANWGQDVINEATSGGTDTLSFTAVTAALTFNIGANTITDGTNNVTQSDTAAEDLIGGSNADTFVFQDGASLAGTIDGGGNPGLAPNTLDYSAYTTAVTVNLLTGAATGTAGVSNISTLLGGAGNDSLTGDDNANVFTGNAGDDTFVGNGSNDTYKFNDNWGNDTFNEATGGGIDTLDFSAVTANVTFTVGTSNVTDGTSTLTQADTSVEGIIAGAGDDTFVFPDGASVPGALNGGGGNNTLDYSAYTTAVSVNLLTSAATGTASIASFSNVIGGSSNDTLIGNDAGNVLTGNAGNDSLTGNAGDDALTGGLGDDTYKFTANWGDDTLNEATGGNSDTVDFSSISTPMTFTVGSANITDGTNTVAQPDTIAENILAGSGDDTFVFPVGVTQAGTINGGGGANTLDLSAYTTALSINLLTGTANIATSVQSISNITGGAGNDTLVGNANNNILLGNAGNDNINGGDGNDSIGGGAGKDKLTGGNGNDSITGDASSDNIRGGAGNDTLSGGGGNDKINGDAGNDKISGGAGNDTLTGGAGSDNISGGAGNDSFFGKDKKRDTLNGGAGTDTAVFDLNKDILKGI